MEIYKCHNGMTCVEGKGDRLWLAAEGEFLRVVIRNEPVQLVTFQEFEELMRPTPESVVAQSERFGLRYRP